MGNQFLSALFAHPPMDVIVFLVVAVILFVDSLRSGTGRAAAVALAAPAAYFLNSALAHAAVLSSILSSISGALVHAVLFGAIFVFLVIFFHRIMYSYGGSSSGALQSLLASLAATAVLIVVWLQIPSLATVWHFGAVFQSLFGTLYAFWWIAAAYILLAFVRS